VDRIFITVSIPLGFKEKFVNFLTNVNSQNDDIIIVEDACIKEVVAQSTQTLEKLYLPRARG
jgi:hypothetical protein